MQLKQTPTMQMVTRYRTQTPPARRGMRPATGARQSAERKAKETGNRKARTAADRNAQAAAVPTETVTRNEVYRHSTDIVVASHAGSAAKLERSLEKNSLKETSAVASKNFSLQKRKRLGEVWGRSSETQASPDFADEAEASTRSGESKEERLERKGELLQLKSATPAPRERPRRRNPRGFTAKNRNTLARE
ncbi:hypothetical protein TGVEG_268178 [Toxoplasma gondii VEG]|uniref:Uncharacterized protein n=3 Tax=Toxoplasma gondii TaxID=5811 RepID=B9Q509_TOXGV|nr:hypothetical protein TGVEG_268178 [Toxoplasma gondii VEG]KFG52553.1 hypothetical protein TGP89_268178 [Toxoplasma gondii p89]PUA87648.1 hypothetical protein TGBR9_268178 [Toxoplasma gondii TgCATBr9]